MKRGDTPPSPASVRECFEIMAREQRQEYIDHLRWCAGADSAFPCLFPDCADGQVPGGPCYGRTEKCT